MKAIFNHALPGLAKAMAVFFLLVFFLGAAAAQHPPRLPDTLKKQIDEVFLAWDTTWTPGVAVAVVKDGGIAYSNAYGYAHLEYDIPNTPTTIFHIASISKQFTTFSILLLEAEGKLSLDDEIQQYIPELPYFNYPVTLRHMAHNVSGLRDQWNLLGMAGWRLDDVITTQQVLRLLSRQKELNFKPGAEYLYSNSGFTLLAEVVARVSGQSFADFTQERIFEPLGMQNTLFYDDHEKIVKNRAYSYAGRDGNYRKRVLSYATVGATSLFTTVEDLGLWAMNFENPVVGDQGIIEKINTRGVLNDDTTISYALGQTVGEYRGLPMISHGGADAGYRTFLARFPEQGVAIVVFSNDAGFSSNAMAMRMVDIVLADFLDEKPEEDSPTREFVKVDPRVLASYEGHFLHQPDNHIIFKTAQDTLFFRTSASSRLVPLFALSDREFVTEGGETRFGFPDPENGEVNMVNMHRNDETIRMPRAEAFDPAGVDLSILAGTYYSEELDITWLLDVTEDSDGQPQLVARHVRIGDITLNPLTPDYFSGNMWYASRLRFERDGIGRITGFRVSAGRVRDLLFERHVR